MKDFKEIRNRLKNDSIELSDNDDNLIELFRGHNDSFCLMLNAKVIKSVKTWQPIENKIKTFKGLQEIEL